MRRPGRQVVLLAVVAGAGLLAVMIASRDGSESAAGAPAASSARTPGAGEPAPATPVADVKLELLETPRAELGEPERNPFRFRPRPAAPAPPRPAAASPTPAAATPSRPPDPPAPVGPPPIPLRFIGLFDAPARTGFVAIMSDGRGNVFQGKEGDIIEGRYRIGRVTTESLELSYTDGRGRQVIRLSGQ